jgi:hypothetical protein
VATRPGQVGPIVRWDPVAWKRFYARARPPSWILRAGFTLTRVLYLVLLLCLIWAVVMAFGLDSEFHLERVGRGLFVLLAAAALLKAVCDHAGPRHARTTLRRHGHQLCTSCGYDLQGNSSPGKCPECGEPFAHEALEQFWVFYLAFLDAYWRQNYWWIQR